MFRPYKSIITTLLLTSFISSSRSVCAQSLCPATDGASFQLGAGNYVRLPVGRFLLVRKDGQIGAIRILSSHHDESVQPRAGEWIGTVEYESFFSQDPNKLKTSSNTRHSGEITFGRMKGYGFHYSWQSGSGKTLVGPWRLRILGADSISVGKYIDDKSYEFAATSACSVADIPDNAKLQWFHYDRETTHTLYVSDLPSER